MSKRTGKNKNARPIGNASSASASTQSPATTNANFVSSSSTATSLASLEDEPISSNQASTQKSSNQASANKASSTTSTIRHSRNDSLDPLTDDDDERSRQNRHSTTSVDDHLEHDDDDMLNRSGSITDEEEAAFQRDRERDRLTSRQSQQQSSSQSRSIPLNLASSSTQRYGSYYESSDDDNDLDSTQYLLGGVGVGVGVGVGGDESATLSDGLSVDIKRTKLNSKYKKKLRRGQQASNLLKFKRIKRHQQEMSILPQRGSGAYYHLPSSKTQVGDDSLSLPHIADDELYDHDGPASASNRNSSSSMSSMKLHSGSLSARSSMPMMRLSGYCTCETFDIESVIHWCESSANSNAFTQDAHLTLFADVLHIRQRQLKREIFIFSYGCIVFFNISESKEVDFLRSIRRFSYSPNAAESEDFDLAVGQGKFSVQNDTVLLSGESSLEKLSVSFAIAQCCKLNVYEERISRTIETSAHLPSTLASTGKIGLSRSEVSKLIGIIFVERSNVNLHSFLLESPEILWEQDKYVACYEKMISYLEISKRVELLNKRLDLLHELFDMLNDSLESAHASYLELIIIYLIVFEVVIAVFWQILLKDILGFFPRSSG